MNIKPIHGIAATAIMIAGLTLGCSRAEPQAQSTPTLAEVEVSAVVWQPSPEMIARGQEVFEATCTKCHTVDGLPIKAGPDLSDFGNEGWSLTRVMDTITDFQRYYPGSSMPTWDKSYPTQDIEAVAGYIMSLRAQAYYVEAR